MKYIWYEEKILKEISKVLKNNPEKSEKNLVCALIDFPSVFILGAGRSGLIAKAFAMRLIQLGLTSHVVGETTTPALTKNDLLISLSGSGETKTIIDIVLEAKEKGAKTIIITSNEKSSLAKISSIVIILKSKTKKSGKSIQPLGSLFEQSAFIFLEATILGIMKKKKITEEIMKQNHANLE
ncbi:MAG: 6-phospho-3-hexuloisomerase [Candidatus Diapherotrites archaeon]|nr:6-phospho-3-hexuloisomerase [Candidatus Diapherotrites archaeon]